VKEKRLRVSEKMGVVVLLVRLGLSKLESCKACSENSLGISVRGKLYLCRE